MKKKILLLLIALFSFPNMVYALEYMNLSFSCEFYENVDMSKISEIYVRFDDLTGYNHDVFLKSDSSYASVIDNIPVGDINITLTAVSTDYINEYPIETRIEEIDAYNKNIILTVSKRDVLTLEDTKGTTVVKKEYIDQIVGDKTTSSTSKTTRKFNEYTSKYSPNGEIVKDTTVTNKNGEEVTTTSYEEYLVQERKKEERKEKEKREKEEKKKDTVFTIMFIILGVLALGGTYYVAWKVYQANK